MADSKAADAAKAAEAAAEDVAKTAEAEAKVDAQKVLPKVESFAVDLEKNLVDEAKRVVSWTAQKLRHIV